MTDSDSGGQTRPSLLLRLRDAADAASWQTFAETYAPLIYRHCRRHGLQDADAADVTQEVLDQVVRSIRTFEYRPERGRFRDWLGTVTRHKLARFHRRQGRAAVGAGGRGDPLSTFSPAKNAVVAPQLTRQAIPLCEVMHDPDDHPSFGCPRR